MKKFCAHRGLSKLMPENTLPAFAAALALGADEIEFDIRLTKDQKLIVSHDGTLERISDGEGKLKDKTLDELLALNIGVKHGWEVGFCTAEEVFEQFAEEAASFEVHTGGRLVQNQQFGLLLEGKGKEHPLHLSAGKRAYPAFHDVGCVNHFQKMGSLDGGL